MNVRVLPVRPKVFQDETAGSLLIRAAQLNGHCSVYQLLSGAGFRSHHLSLQATLSNSQRFIQVANDVGLGIEARQTVLYRAGPTRASPVVLFDRHVPLSLLHDDVTAFCPHCLCEDDYWRKGWLFRPLAACHRHGCLLIDRCTNCGELPNVGRGTLNECSSCGASYMSMSTRKVDVTTIDDLVVALGESTSLSHAFAFWLALERFDCEDQSPASNYRRTHIMMQFLTDVEKAADWLASAMLARSSMAHPRIQLVHFLVAGGSVAQCASLAIKKLSDHPDIAGTEQPKGELSKSEVCAVLEISHFQLLNFIRNGTVNWPSYGGRQQKISAIEIDRMIRHRDLGVSSVNRRRYTIVRESHEWADIIAVSERLRAHPDVVRTLIRAGWLASVSCTFGGRRKTVVPLDKLLEFENEFVLVGTLASEWGVNPTNLREKLQSIGVYPVGGPGLDAVMTSLFRRDALTQIDSEVIGAIEEYPTRTGRRPHGHQPIRRFPRALPITDVAAILQISTQKVAQLVRKGFLIRESPITRPIFVKRSSLRKFQKLLDSPEWMRVADAAEDIGISVTALTKTWIKGGVVQHLALGPWRLVKKVDVEQVKRLRTEFLTPSEAGRLLNTHRSHMTNLERRGAATAIRIGESGAVRLYRKDDVRGEST